VGVSLVISVVWWEMVQWRISSQPWQALPEEKAAYLYAALARWPQSLAPLTVLAMPSPGIDDTQKAKGGGT